MSISYVTDPSTGGVGAFVDDTSVVVGDATRDHEGFETGLGAWSLRGEPAGSPPGGGNFSRCPGLAVRGGGHPGLGSFGFGVEQLASPAERASVLGSAVRYLLPSPL